MPLHVPLVFIAGAMFALFLLAITQIFHGFGFGPDDEEEDEE